MAFVTGWASLRLWRSFKLIYVHYSCLKYSYIRAHIILESYQLKERKSFTNYRNCFTNSHFEFHRVLSRDAVSSEKEANFIVLAKHFLQSLIHSLRNSRNHSLGYPFCTPILYTIPFPIEKCILYRFHVTN